MMDTLLDPPEQAQQQLKAENERLRKENDRLHRELDKSIIRAGYEETLKCRWERGLLEIGAERDALRAEVERLTNLLSPLPTGEGPGARVAGAGARAAGSGYVQAEGENG